MQQIKIINPLLYLMCVCSIILAKPNNSSSKQENKRNNDKNKTKVRRHEEPCDYLYEDCDNIEYKYDEFSTENKGVKEENNNRKETIHKKEKKEFEKSHEHEKLSVVDSLEDFNYDVVTFKPYNGPDKVSLRQNTRSTQHMWFDGPPDFQSLPPFIALCKGKARCHMPFNKNSR